MYPPPLHTANQPVASVLLVQVRVRAANLVDEGSPDGQLLCRGRMTASVSVSLRNGEAPPDSLASSYRSNASVQSPLESSDEIPCHPLGVKPSGNALTATRDLRAAIGAFNALPDEVILILFEYLDASSLLSIGRTCKALYAFTRSEELWKTLFIR